MNIPIVDSSAETNEEHISRLRSYYCGAEDASYDKRYETTCKPKKGCFVETRYHTFLAKRKFHFVLNPTALGVDQTRPDAVKSYGYTNVRLDGIFSEEDSIDLYIGGFAFNSAWPGSYPTVNLFDLSNDSVFPALARSDIAIRGTFEHDVHLVYDVVVVKHNQELTYSFWHRQIQFTGIDCSMQVCGKHTLKLLSSHLIVSLHANLSESAHNVRLILDGQHIIKFTKIVPRPDQISHTKWIIEFGEAGLNFSKINRAFVEYNSSEEENESAIFAVLLSHVRISLGIAHISYM